MITNLFLFMQKLRKRLTLTSILDGCISKHCACVIGNVGDGNFRPSFLYKAIYRQRTG